MIPRRPVLPTNLQVRLRPHAAALVPGLALVGLMLVWAVHNGGYDTETWSWGALAALALLGASIVALRGRLRLTRGRGVVIGLFAAYVAWCYLSMAWAQAPGEALQGGNQALLYLIVFALALVLPWTVEAAFAVLVVFVAGAGLIGIVLMIDLASGHHVGSLVIDGRLAAPTGYFNSTAALFTIDALAAIGLAARRELPTMLRGLLLAEACCGLQLALIVQSRGWLFTLPLVAIAGIVVVHERFRVLLAALLPVAGTLAVVHRLLGVYESAGGAALRRAAARAGQPALLICLGVAVLATLLAWADSRWRAPALASGTRRTVGVATGALLVLAFATSGTVLTHGHPLRFISRQWNGFSHEQTRFSSSSHFGDVGSGRYDFWRVALDAFIAHPIGGLGEDNFADYYVVHRRTAEEPSWTHSLEMRLLAQTGLVGFALFTAFMVSALALAVRARRTGEPLARAVTGVALLALVVWLIHGSVDWFWEIPALSGPALGFLGLAGSLSAPALAPAPAPDARPTVADTRPTVAGRADVRGAHRTRRGARGARGPIVSGSLAMLLGGIVFVLAVIVLGLSYLSVRDVSLGSDAGGADPTVALSDFATAADLDPFNSTPGRLAGTVALANREYAVAEQRFAESIAREPGGWYAWLGAGLAQSALGHRGAARADFAKAYSINRLQPAVSAGLQRVDSRHPLTPPEAFRLLVLEE